MDSRFPSLELSIRWHAPRVPLRLPPLQSILSPLQKAVICRPSGVDTVRCLAAGNFVSNHRTLPMCSRLSLSKRLAVADSSVCNCYDSAGTGLVDSPAMFGESVGPSGS